MVYSGEGMYGFGFVDVFGLELDKVDVGVVGEDGVYDGVFVVEFFEGGGEVGVECGDIGGIKGVYCFIEEVE